ncbi:MAG: hypothetical protein WAN05_11270, partial [Roseiarcus sp.]
MTTTVTRTFKSEFSSSARQDQGTTAVKHKNIEVRWMSRKDLADESALEFSRVFDFTGRVV